MYGDVFAAGRAKNLYRESWARGKLQLPSRQESASHASAVPDTCLTDHVSPTPDPTPTPPAPDPKKPRKTPGPVDQKKLDQLDKDQQVVRAVIDEAQNDAGFASALGTHL